MVIKEKLLFFIILFSIINQQQKLSAADFNFNSKIKWGTIIATPSLFLTIGCKIYIKKIKSEISELRKKIKKTENQNKKQRLIQKLENKENILKWGSVGKLAGYAGILVGGATICLGVLDNFRGENEVEEEEEINEEINRERKNTEETEKESENKKEQLVKKQKDDPLKNLEKTVNSLYKKTSKKRIELKRKKLDLNLKKTELQNKLELCKAGIKNKERSISELNKNINENTDGVTKKVIEKFEKLIAEQRNNKNSLEQKIEKTEQKEKKLQPIFDLVESINSAKIESDLATNNSKEKASLLKQLENKLNQFETDYKEIT